MLLSGKDKSANLKEWQMPCAELICLSLPPSASAHNSSMLFSIIVREGRNWEKKKSTKQWQENRKIEFKKSQMGKKIIEVIINN